MLIAQITDLHVGVTVDVDGRDWVRHGVWHLLGIGLKIRRMSMVEIKIIGTGCAKCAKLSENAEVAAKSLGIDYAIGKITDRNEIIEAGVMMTPALMVDGEIKSSGRVLSPDEIKPLLS